jgi:hypothetical protein
MWSGDVEGRRGGATWRGNAVAVAEPIPGTGALAALGDRIPVRMLLAGRWMAGLAGYCQSNETVTTSLRAGSGSAAGAPRDGMQGRPCGCHYRTRSGQDAR